MLGDHNMNIGRLHVSILNCSFGNLREELRELKGLGITHIHIDIADTSFTDDISFGPNLVNYILQHAFIFNIHIMVNEPAKILRKLKLNSAHTVFLHIESDGLEESVEILKVRNCKIGVAYKRETLVTNIPKFASEVLILAVDPGKGGQVLDQKCIGKISHIKRIDPNIKVGFDGGVSLLNLYDIIEADFFVIGTDFVRSDNKKEYLNKFLCF